MLILQFNYDVQIVFPFRSKKGLITVLVDSSSLQSARQGSQ